MLFIIPIILALLLLPLILTPAAGRDIVGGGSVPRVSTVQQAVLAKYRKYKIKKPPSFKAFCYPQGYSVQPQQRWIGEYMAPGAIGDIAAHREILLFHRIGAGKTCASIQICEKWIGWGEAPRTRSRASKPLVIMPASLIPGYYDELRTGCGGGRYIPGEFAKSAAPVPGTEEYADYIAESNALIDEKYQIMSYNAFADRWRKIEAPIIVIDEVQNISNTAGAFFRAAYGWIDAHPKAAVVLMSATPIFDNPRELEALRLLLRAPRPLDKPADITRELAGKVSYFAGAPAYTYPKVHLKVLECRMSDFQARWYRSEVAAEMSKAGAIRHLEVSNNFYIKSRQRSNIVFPRGLRGEQGLGALTAAHIRDSLATYSAKFATLVKKLSRGKLSFVYSAFTGPGGVEAITKCLRAYGWKDYATHGPGRRRYALWTGDENRKYKASIRAVFNDTKNDDASQIQVIIGSPAIKEGVSLMRVAQAHIMEPYWNHSRLAQIYGRVNRFCSHKRLPAADREVSIYLYAAIAGPRPRAHTVRLPEAGPSQMLSVEQSVDLLMLQMADTKAAENAPYVDALVACAADKLLWQGP